MFSQAALWSLWKLRNHFYFQNGVWHLARHGYDRGMLYRKQKLHRDVDEAEAQVQEVWQAGVLIERTMIVEWEDDQESDNIMGVIGSKQSIVWSCANVDSASHTESVRI
jgi:hypothetical protein